MKLKGFISGVVAILLASNMCIATVAAGTNSNAHDTSADILTAKTAYLSNIDEYGSNWGNDTISQNQNVVSDTAIEQSVEGSTLNLKIRINGEDLIVSGTPIGTSENKNVVYFDAFTNSTKYTLVTFSYEKDIENSNVYFDGYMHQNGKENGCLLKVYLRDNTADTRSYVLYEVFDYTLPYDSAILNTLPEATEFGSWVTKEFKPSDSDEIKMPTSTRAKTSDFTIKISKTFTEGIIQQEHTISLTFICSYANVPVGQDAIEGYTLKVTGKTVNAPNAPNYNSSTSSALHVDNAALRQTSVPNTAWYSTDIDGSAQNNGGGILSANLGIGLGVLSIDLSIPNAFNGHGTVDINDGYKTYDNYHDHYVRSIKTQFSNNYKLTQIGHYFNVSSVLRDFGNVQRGSSMLRAIWDIRIINASTHETWTYNYQHNSFISIA